MKKSILVLTLAAAVTCGWAQQASVPAVTSQMKTVSATIQAVYPDKRSLTLVGPQGQQQTIFVDPAVELDRVHVGDQVRVSLYQGVAAQIAKGDAKLADPAAASFAYRSSDARPTGGAGDSVTVTVKILGVDPDTNTVAFQQADGSQHVIEVKSPNMQQFIRTLNAGDIVDVTYTESVAVSVIPAP